LVNFASSRVFFRVNCKILCGGMVFGVRVLYCGALEFCWVKLGVSMPRMKLLVVFAFLLVVAPFRASAFQLGGSGVKDNFLISGNVYLKDTSHPAVNVLVRLRGIEGSDLADASTNDSGAFMLYNLKPAIYTLELQVEGFQRSETQVDLEFSSTRSVQIILAPDPKAGNEKPAATVSSHELSIPAKAREMYQSGKIKLYEQNDPTGALEEFNSALTLAPAYYEAEYQIAMAYLAQGKREEAAASFQKSVDMSEQKYGPGFVGLGTLAIDKHDDAAGEKLVHQGVTLSPDFWLGHYELGRVLFNEGKTDDAAKAAEQAKSLAPNEPITYRLLTNIHIKQKDYRAAVADIDQYVKLDPDSAAGRRAKEIRDQLAQKVDQQTPPATTQPASGGAPKLQQ
jgi:tetratricopeptide (TPR) repeat protein